MRFLYALSFNILWLISFTVYGAELKEVEIGLASNFSEPSTSASNPFGDYFRNGIQLALKIKDQELQKKGIKIKLKEFDYGTKPVRVLEAAKNAAGSSVIAVLGYNMSSHALLAAPLHQKYQLPMLTPSATADRIGTFGPFVHQACFDNAFMSKTLANLAREKFKAKNVVIIVAADCAYCQDLSKGFKKEFYKMQKVEPIEIPTLEAETDFKSVIEKVKKIQPDTIFLPNQELLAARIISAFTKAGIRAPFLGGDGWGLVGEDFHKIVGNADFQSYSITHWHENIDTDLSRTFIRDYENAFGKKPNDTSVLAYDSMMLLIYAILQTPALTRQGVETSLNQIKTFEGVTGTFIYKGARSPAKSLVLIKKEKDGFSAVTTLHPI
jgi:branched-chain amino acid transport system substrate-binding protein